MGAAAIPCAVPLTDICFRLCVNACQNNLFTERGTCQENIGGQPQVALNISFWLGLMKFSSMPEISRDFFDDPAKILFAAFLTYSQK